MMWKFSAALAALIALAACSDGKQNAETVAKLQTRLAYLDDIDAISRFEILDEGARNNVVIFFTSKPENFGWIVNGAALAGNMEIDFGVHVWAAPSDYTGDLPPITYICTASARYGKVQKSDC